MAITIEEYGKKYDYHDLNRLGLFSEMPYLNAVEAKNIKSKIKELPVLKKHEVLRSMLPGYPKTKCGNQDGYFETEYKGLSWAKFSKKPKKKKQNLVSKTPFLPAGPTKKQASPGDYYGCFVKGKWPERFSPILKDNQQKPKKKSKLVARKPNPLTNPIKKGGPGYADITLNPYPAHIVQPVAKPKKKVEHGIKTKSSNYFYSGHRNKYCYDNPYIDVFDDPPSGPTYIKPKVKIYNTTLDHPHFVINGPNKWNGTSERWSGQIEKYVASSKVPKSKNIMEDNPNFVPTYTCLKTLQTVSVLSNTQYTVNQKTWKSYKPTYVKNL